MPGSSGPTKSQVFDSIAQDTGLTKKQVASVFESLNAAIAKSLSREGAFVIPDLLKVKVKHVKARPAKMGRNPRTGEEMMFAAKPARKGISLSARKTLKEMV